MQTISVAKVDLYLFNLIHGHAKKSRILDFFAIFLAEYAGYALVVVLLLYAFMAAHWQIFFIPMAAGVTGRFLMAEAIYFLYQRKRPVEVLSINSLIKTPNHPSFPSGHASFFFALSFTLFLFNAPLALIFITVSFLISLARIFCGVHWPSDILGGIFFALIPFLVIYASLII